MANYINQDDLIYVLQKDLHKHKNNNDPEDVAAKALIEHMIKFIKSFPTTDIEFKNGIISVKARQIIKDGE